MPDSLRLRLYLRIRAVPMYRAELMLERLNNAREGGWFSRALAAVTVGVDVAEMILMPRTLHQHIPEEGYVLVPSHLSEWAESLLRGAADRSESGRPTADGSIHTLRSAEMGLLMLSHMEEKALIYVHRERFAQWAERRLWMTGLIDLRIRGTERYSDTSKVTLRTRKRPVDPAPTSNPSPEALAAVANGVDGTHRVIVLIGPSGSGKSITAAAIARSLQAGDRTLRISASTMEDVELGLEFLPFLRPTCLIFDDLPMVNTAPVMALLDELQDLAHRPLVIFTIMHEGSPEEVRLPGLRPERVDLIRFFHAPTAEDAIQILRHHGLDEDRAVVLASDSRLAGWTGAYLAALAKGILRGESSEGLIEALAVQRRIAAYNAAALL